MTTSQNWRTLGLTMLSVVAINALFLFRTQGSFAWVILVILATVGVAIVIWSVRLAPK